MSARWTSTLAACSAVFAGACQSTPQQPEERPRRATELPVAAGPASTAPRPFPQGESIRVGVAGGYRLASVEIDRDSTTVLAPELADGHGWGGFVEIIADDFVHLRLFGARTDHEVLGTTTTARILQGALLAMASFENAVTEHITFSPLFGLGIGYTEVDFDPLLGISERDGVSLLIAGAVEAEVAHHAFLGAMLTAELFGDPGDTEGDIGSVLLYAGVRF